MWPFRKAVRQNPIEGCQILAVNEHADLVAFSQDGARVGGQSIFWAEAFSKALHFHRESFTQQTEGAWQSMEKIPTGNVVNPQQMALFCKQCGLRIVVPACGLSRDELKAVFQEWNTAPNVYDRIFATT